MQDVFSMMMDPKKSEISNFDLNDLRAVSNTSCDVDDEVCDDETLEAFGMHEIDQAELARWALFGDLSAPDEMR
jgi:hypothetical protein